MLAHVRDVLVVGLAVGWFEEVVHFRCLINADADRVLGRAGFDGLDVLFALLAGFAAFGALLTGRADFFRLLSERTLLKGLFVSESAFVLANHFI